MFLSTYYVPLALWLFNSIFKTTWKFGMIIMPQFIQGGTENFELSPVGPSKLNLPKVPLAVEIISGLFCHLNCYCLC